MTNTSNKPENVIRIGNISAAIWKRLGKEGNGHFYSVQLQRSYRTVDGTQYTDSFNHEDLLNVVWITLLTEQRILVSKPGKNDIRMDSSVLVAINLF